jgi:hypothetical protein
MMNFIRLRRRPRVYPWSSILPLDNFTNFVKVSHPLLSFDDFKMLCSVQVDPSTPQPEGWGLLRVDPERRFLPRPKGRGLAPSNGSMTNTYLISFLKAVAFYYVWVKGEPESRSLRQHDQPILELDLFSIEW